LNKRGLRLEKEPHALGATEHARDKEWRATIVDGKTDRGSRGDEMPHDARIPLLAREEESGVACPGDLLVNGGASVNEGLNTLFVVPACCNQKRELARGHGLPQQSAAIAEQLHAGRMALLSGDEQRRGAVRGVVDRRTGSKQ